jgi:hypothetical protein
MKELVCSIILIRSRLQVPETRTLTARRQQRNKDAVYRSADYPKLKLLASALGLGIVAARRFESFEFGADGLVAQLVEQCPFKALVPGSSPGQPTIPPHGDFSVR